MSDCISLTTDFGWSEYVGAIKAVLMRDCPQARVLDITHDIHRHHIVHGAFVLASSVLFCPRGSTHIGVVDPGVGTDRAGLMIECKGGFLVGPDNGLLIPAARKLGLGSLFKITSTEYLPRTISSTFHGRDIFAPIGAQLANGVRPDDMGEKIDACVDLSLERYKEEEAAIKAEVLFADRFGNLITGLPGGVLLEHFSQGEKIRINWDGRTLQARLVESYGNEPRNSRVVVVSSAGFTELAIVEGNARHETQIQDGNWITLWKN